MCGDEEPAAEFFVCLCCVVTGEVSPPGVQQRNIRTNDWISGLTGTRSSPAHGFSCNCAYSRDSRNFKDAATLDFSHIADLISRRVLAEDDTNVDLAAALELRTRLMTP